MGITRSRIAEFVLPRGPMIRYLVDIQKQTVLFEIYNYCYIEVLSLTSIIAILCRPMRSLGSQNVEAIDRTKQIKQSHFVRLYCVNQLVPISPVHSLRRSLQWNKTCTTPFFFLFFMTSVALAKINDLHRCLIHFSAQFFQNL